MSDQPEHTIDANYFIYWEQRALTAERKHTEALAEIERLKAGTKEYACTGTDHPCGCYDQFLSERAEIELQRTTIADTMSDLAKAEAEIERLLDVLKAIECHSIDHTDACRMAGKARAALEHKP